MLAYLDLKEYQSKFLLNPDLQTDEDYSHLDKNLAITNLQHNPKLGINEPEEARAILKALHVLNNPKHYKKVRKIIFVGYYTEKQIDGRSLQKPIYRDVVVDVPKYPKTFHNIRSKWFSFVNTSAARGGHRIKAAMTNRLVKEESIEDKTKVQSRFSLFGGKKDTGNY